jgi:hypothetical protein
MLLTGSDEGYDAARRIWNGMIDRRPAVIARCATSTMFGQRLNVGGGLGYLIESMEPCATTSSRSIYLSEWRVFGRQ